MKLKKNNLNYLTIDIEKKGKVKTKAAAFKALQSEMLRRGYRSNWKILTDREKAIGSILNPLRKKYYRFSIRLDGEMQRNIKNADIGISKNLSSDDYLERLIENQNQMIAGQPAANQSVIDRKILTKQKVSNKDLQLYEDLIKQKQEELGFNNSLNTVATKVTASVADFSSREKQSNQSAIAIDGDLKNKITANGMRKEMLELLEEKDFSKKFIQEIFYDLDKNHTLPKSDFSNLINIVIDIIVNKVTYSDLPKKYDGIPNLLFFVGPTGVGKTTTIFKLAYELMHVQKQKICLVSYDIVKLAGTEQLKQYANMTKAPYKQIVKTEDIKDIYHAHAKEYSFVCVDFAGASSKDKERLIEMQQMVFALSCPSEVNLCLNAGIKYRDMLKIAEAFAPLKYDRVIVTKTDDTDSLGTILSFLWENEIPVSCFTNGQEIPRDIVFLNAEKLKEILVKDFIMIK